MASLLIRTLSQRDFARRLGSVQPTRSVWGLRSRGCEKRGRVWVGYLLCVAPFGPFRQKVPDPFLRISYTRPRTTATLPRVILFTHRSFSTIAATGSRLWTCTQPHLTARRLSDSRDGPSHGRIASGETHTLVQKRSLEFAPVFL